MGSGRVRWSIVQSRIPRDALLIIAQFPTVRARTHVLGDSRATERGARLHAGGFAGPVRTEQRMHSPAGHSQIKPGKHLPLAITPPQTRHRDRVLASHPALLPVRDTRRDTEQLHEMRFHNPFSAVSGPSDSTNAFCVPTA